jgi:hypothetical protein
MISLGSDSDVGYAKQILKDSETSQSITHNANHPKSSQAILRAELESFAPHRWRYLTMCKLQVGGQPKGPNFSPLSPMFVATELTGRG